MAKLNIVEICNNSKETDIRVTLVPGLHPNTRAEKVLNELKAQEVHVDMVWVPSRGWLVTAELWHGLDENYQDIESTLVPWMSIAEEKSFTWWLNRKLKGILPQMHQEIIDFNPPWEDDNWD